MLFGLLSFQNAGFQPDNQLQIEGKWYFNGENNYYKEPNGFGQSRWYEFSSNTKLTYSTCTDMCGCMRKTYYGKFNWENDSVITVNYYKCKDEFSGDIVHFERLKTEQLGIIQIDTAHINIFPIRP